MKPTFGSLFAGIGGFDMGMEQAGWSCKFQVEWDKDCLSILDHHWADVPKLGDIREVDGRLLPPVDCIIFGSPCQDLSNQPLAGTRTGLSGKRSGLFHELCVSHSGSVAPTKMLLMIISCFCISVLLLNFQAVCLIRQV